MTPLPVNEPEESGGSGAPAWMLTYGDSVTLLLTFFVLLLTFSTPDEEGFAELARGFLPGGRRPALSDEGSGGRITPEERRLSSARLDSEGAEKPPMEEEQPLKALQRHFEELDVSELPRLEGAQVIRIPLVDLFGTGTELVSGGRRILHSVIRVSRAGSYSIVVRALAGAVAPQAQRERMSIAFAARVAGYLRAEGGQPCADTGVSDNVQLLGTPLQPGTCEIILLEV